MSKKKTGRTLLLGRSGTEAQSFGKPEPLMHDAAGVLYHIKVMRARTRNPYRISNWVILLVFIFGAALLALYLWQGYAIHQARSWPTTEATVISCQVTSTTNLISGKLGNRVVRWDDLNFAFSYRVSGREYVSKRFYILTHPPPHYVAREFPVGRRFSANYSAKAPEMAVVEPGPHYHRALVIAVVCLGFVVAGIVYNRFQT